MIEPQPVGRFALINGRVVLPGAVAIGKAVIVEGARIVAVVDVDALGAGIHAVDVGGRYIVPGLIDIHTHGAVGRSFNEPSAGAWATIAERNAACGVTSLLATLATASIDDLVACLRLAREWRGAPRAGAQVIGVHLEGPYFSYEQRGAQDPRHLRVPDDGTATALLKHADVLRMMSFAPELPGALDLTARLLGLGIVAAAGHSSAKDVDVLAAMRTGLGHVIHLWSGQSTTSARGHGADRDCWRRPFVSTALPRK